MDSRLWITLALASLLRPTLAQTVVALNGTAMTSSGYIPPSVPIDISEGQNMVSVEPGAAQLHTPAPARLPRRLTRRSTGQPR